MIFLTIVGAAVLGVLLVLGLAVFLGSIVAAIAMKDDAPHE